MLMCFMFLDVFLFQAATGIHLVSVNVLSWNFATNLTKVNADFCCVPNQIPHLIHVHSVHCLHSTLTGCDWVVLSQIKHGSCALIWKWRLQHVTSIIAFYLWSALLTWLENKLFTFLSVPCFTRHVNHDNICANNVSSFLGHHFHNFENTLMVPHRPLRERVRSVHCSTLNCFDCFHCTILVLIVHWIFTCSKCEYGSMQTEMQYWYLLWWTTQQEQESARRDFYAIVK